MGDQWPAPPPPVPSERPPSHAGRRVLIGVIGALLLALGVLVGILATTGADGEKGPTSVATETNSVTLVTVETPGGTVTKTTTASPTPAPADDWPGGTAYTAVLASMKSQAGARAKQQQGESRGLQAGVLRTNDYSSLTPGYWAVFSGAFAAREDAATRVAEARAAGFTDAYVRLVRP